MKKTPTPIKPIQAEKSGARETITIFDTTLRDGEQSPGAAMTLEEKCRIAHQLDDMGVDVIEAGFPAASLGDFEAVKTIAKNAKNATICGLARASHNDIRRAGEAVAFACHGRIHTFLSTSPVHMKHKLQMDSEDVYQAVIDSVKYARNLIDEVEWSPEDATRTEHDFLCRCIEAAIDSGASIINIPDTVGYSVPDEMVELISMIRARVPNIDKAVLSIHCHNDLGLAVANSLAAIGAGARQVECTINGLGERAGNAAMEEIVMALKVRSDRLAFDTNIDTTQFTKASRLVSSITAFPVQYNKAIVGKNAFSHESGIHQDGMIKNNQTYEIMAPETIGLTSSSLILGKLSGRNAFRKKISDLGYELGDNAIADAFRRFKDLADQKRNIYDEDIIALIDDEFAHSTARIQFIALRVEAGTHGPQKAHLQLKIDGKQVETICEGNGPVDAIFRAIGELVPHKAKLALYQVHAVTGGTDAQAEVSVRLEIDGRSAYGRGADMDTLVASTRAYLSALNKIEVAPHMNAQKDRA